MKTPILYSLTIHQHVMILIGVMILLVLSACGNDGANESVAPIVIPETSFHGVVRHGSRGPIANAVVTISGKSDTTNANGFFRIDDILDSEGLTTQENLKVSHSKFNGFDGPVTISKSVMPFEVILTLTIDEVVAITEDTYVWDSLPNTNFGADENLFLQFSDSIAFSPLGRMRSYLSLPTPTEVVATDVEKALLFLTVIDFGFVSRLQILNESPRSSWSETDVTWVTSPSEYEPSNKIAEIQINALKPHQLQLDITSVFTLNQASNGIRLTLAEEKISNTNGMVRIASSDHSDQKLRPFVIFTYTF